MSIFPRSAVQSTASKWCRRTDWWRSAPRSFFAATIGIHEDELRQLEGRKLLPGMTSEAMITDVRPDDAYLTEPAVSEHPPRVRKK
jgi:hypothetical protein